MALINYARPDVWAGETGRGALVNLKQVKSVTHTTESGDNEVDIMSAGLGGFTPGSGRCRLRIESAVPEQGPEFPFQQASANHNYVTIQFGLGVASYSGSGRVTSVEYSGSATDSTTETCEWVGQVKAFEG